MTLGSAREGRLLGVCVLSVVMLSVLVVGGLYVCGSGPDQPESRASILQVEGAPVAIIDPSMPEIVWNGSQLMLDGSGSYDDDGNITTYAWEVEHNDVVQPLFGETPRYRFMTTGLYMITLTVTDDNGSEGMDFTAVYVVLDSDLDGLPDWWEMKFFNGLSGTASGDPDVDGYSNIEEFAQGTDPLVADPVEGLIEQNWRWFLFGGTAAVIAVIIVSPFLKKKRKEAERKKTELAIEIDKALDEE
jgi:hypothetical protein